MLHPISMTIDVNLLLVQKWMLRFIQILRTVPIISLNLS